LDPRLNPYAPGAGTPPPELAGRDDLIERTAIALDRIRGGLSARSFILYGLRGVGKTVLLNRVQLDAEARGFFAAKIEAPEDRSLPALLVPSLRALLLRLDRGERAKAGIQRALRALAGFAKGLRIRYGDLAIGMEYEPEPGLADSGDLETDLAALLIAVGSAAAERDTAAALFVDELQYVKEEELAALISGLHQASQVQAPIAMVAAGLPQIVGQSGRAKSYAERLFEFVAVDRLNPDAARAALRVPAERRRVLFDESAIAEILKQTQRYPYFLQEWGKHSWDEAARSPIQRADTKRATARALAELDASFFRVRFDRLTPAEKRYLRAMADLGAGPHRSGDIADRLARRVTAVAPTRNALIAKGMIYSPAHGDTAFTVPLFEGFMQRTMPAL
jgi:hypothetical protein